MLGITKKCLPPIDIIWLIDYLILIGWRAKPDWKIVDDCLGMAYSYATFIIDIIDDTGIDPDKVADGITHFVKLYKGEMDAKEAA